MYRYHVLVSLMLSSQTKDHITAEAMRRLKQANLSVEWMLSTPEEEIARLIKPVGFWKVSTIYIAHNGVSVTNSVRLAT